MSTSGRDIASLGRLGSSRAIASVGRLVEVVTVTPTGLPYVRPKADVVPHPCPIAIIVKC